MNRNSWWICALIASVIILAFHVQGNRDRIESIEKCFLPSESGLVSSQDAGPAQLLSTIDLQRELNRRYPKLKLAEDGVYGPATEAAHVRAIGDQYAIELGMGGAK